MLGRQRFATAGVKRILAVGAVIAGAVAFSGCASNPGAGAVEAAQVTGRWTPTATDASPDAFVEFAEDGTLQLSDGCNGAQGEWTLEGGVFSATTGPHTQMFCDGYVPIHSWLDSTESIELSDGVLVLKDADGAELGELAQA